MEQAKFWNPFEGKVENLNDYLDPKNRQQGLSAFVRVKDEEQFIFQTLNSHIDLVDEMVIVYNNCSDSSPKIIESFADQYSNKVKVYEYLPEVFPQGAKEFLDLPDDHSQSLVNYYNFSLAMTTKDIVFKLDCDQFAIRKKFQKVYSRIRKDESISCISFRGCNLYDTDDGIIHVNGVSPVTYPDRGFFRVKKGIFHRSNGFCEALTFNDCYFPDVKSCCDEILYFHLKSMKYDRGVGVWKLNENPNSEYHVREAFYHNGPKLLAAEAFLRKYQQHFGAFSDVDPNRLGIKSQGRAKVAEVQTTPKTSSINHTQAEPYELAQISNPEMKGRPLRFREHVRNTIVSIFQTPPKLTDPLTKKVIPLSSLLKGEYSQKGISGIMRLCREKPFLEEAVSSVIENLDELVIVYCQTNRNLDRRLKKIGKNFGSKIRLYPYPAHVYHPWSKKYSKTPPAAIASLVNMANYALSKVRFTYVIRFNGDQVFVPKLFKQLVLNIRKYGLNHVLVVRGILAVQSEDKFFVDQNRPFIHQSKCSRNMFFKFSSDTFFCKGLVEDELNRSDIVASDPCFYQINFNSSLKSMKLVGWREFIETNYLRDFPMLGERSNDSYKFIGLGAS